MKIKIEDNLFIEADDRQFVIKEYTGKQDKQGNEMFKTHGYFGTLNSAVKKVIKMKLTNKEVNVSLGEFLEELKKVENRIDDLVKI